MKNHLALKISTLIVATACFTVMAGALLISQNLKRVLTYWGQDIQMTVYLSQELEPAQKQKIEDFFKTHSEIKEAKLITQEKALGDFRQQLATYAPELVKDDDLLRLIPASYQISLDSSLSAQQQVETLKALAPEIKKIEGVDDVSYGQDWVEKYSTFVAVVQVLVQILSGIILFASVFVMSNVVRALVQSRREEIEVLELIGATPTMIRRPFLIQGFQMGLLASSCALVVCFVGFKFVHSVFMNQLSFLQLGNQIEFLHILTVMAFLVAGTLLGGLGSYLCVRRLNDGWAASQRAI